MKSHGIPKAALIGSLALAMAAPAWPQLDTATILGIVYDATGSVIQGAQVVVQNQGTSASFTRITDGAGNFIAPSLPVGTYRLTVSYPGFKTNVREGVTVNSADRVRLEITLEPGEVTERVMVSGEAPLVETASTTLGGVVNSQRVSDLPMNGRSITQLVAVIPGVAMLSGNQRVVGGIPTRIFETGAKYLVDGGDSGQVDSDLADGGYQSRARINRVSPEALAEMRVQQNQFSSEYGGGMAGVVNFVTKSGTNQFHGSLFEYFRNEKLDSRNYFNAPPQEQPPYRLNQFGGSLGGPILRDRLFFFTNYEGVRQRNGRTFNTFVPTAEYRNTLPAALRPAVDMLPLPNGPVSAADSRVAQFIGNASDVLTENTGMVKVDYQVTSADRLSVRYNANQADNIIWVGVAKDRARDVPSLLQLGRVNHTRMISPTMLNEATFFVNRLHTDIFGALSPEVRAFPQVSFGSGVTQAGPITPELFTANTSYTWLDTFSVIKGGHQLKLGAQAVRSQMNKERGFGRNLTFQTLNDYSANSPFSAQTVGYPRFGIRITNWSFFAQDDIQVNPNLTLNLGLRYQYDTVPHDNHYRGANYNPETGLVDPEGTPYIDVPKNNFGPRVGIAYAPFASKKTVIRLGAGILYTSLQGSLTQWLPANNPAHSFQRSVVRAQLPGLVGFPFPDLTGQPFGTQTLQYLPYDWRTTHTNQWNINIQQELPQNMMFQIGYIGNRGVHLAPTRDFNPIVPGTGRRRNPLFGAITEYHTGGNSNYNAMQATFRKRMTRGLLFNVNYTWSHSFEDRPSPNPDFREYVTSDFDVRHYLQFDYTYQIPDAPGVPGWLGSGWQLNGITIMRSGQPYSVLCGCDPIGIGANVGRAVPVPGVDMRPANFDIPNNQLNRDAFQAPPAGTYGTLVNNLVGPNVFNWDFSIFKNFRITENQQVQFRTEVFNIFNTPQFGNPSATLNAPASFGRSQSTLTSSTGFGTNRQIQFALRYSF